jgi:tRNA(Arg) A34 adenosine deaminase TadA
MHIPQVLPSNTGRKTHGRILALGALFLFIVLLLLKLFAYGQWRFTPEGPALEDTLSRELVALGELALLSNDVPVSAVLLYGPHVIGSGYNTVLRDGNAGGHAEINAISDAIHHMGLKRFSALSRDSLWLITSFEPCLMCRGAILEYRIDHVSFLKAKSIWNLAKEDLRSLRYEFRRRKREPEGLQDSLFLRARHIPNATATK